MSTIDALQRLKQITQYESSGAMQRRELCLLIIVYVRNIFNSVFWRGIIGTLKWKNVTSLSKSNCPFCGCNRKDGRNLWDLCLDKHYGTCSIIEYWHCGYPRIGYADDVSIVIVARITEAFKTPASNAINQIEWSMRRNKLEIPPEKKKAINLIPSEGI